MRTILLDLVTPAGDELGRVPITEIVVAAAGEPPVAAALPRRTLIDALVADVHTVLQQNGVQPVQRAADIELAVSLALLQEGETDDIIIPLVVQAVPRPAHHSDVDEGTINSAVGDSSARSGAQEEEPIDA